MPSTNQQPQPPANRADELLALAEKQFGTLTPADKILFPAVACGEEAPYRTGSGHEDDPSNAPHWSPDRVLAADRIVWLCTDPAAHALVTYRGIYVNGARFDTALDLNFIKVPFVLSLCNSCFRCNISLANAELAGLKLTGTHVKELGAQGVKISGPVALNSGFVAEGQISFRAATIGSSLDCGNGRFLNRDGQALNLNGSTVGDGVFLNNGFQAEGEVNLVGATIGKNLDCGNGKFTNEGTDKVALQASQMHVEDSAFFSKGFQAKGEVNLIGATIGIDLECDGGRFINKGKGAISADGLKVGGNVILREQFAIEGKARFVNANVSGHFIWAGIVSNKDVSLDLRTAKVGTLRDEETSWPVGGKLFLDGFVYDEIGRDAPTDARSRIRWLRLQPPDEFSPQPYEQLASVLLKAGHGDDRLNVVYAENRERGRHMQRFRGSWWWYGFFGRLIGYGYLWWPPLVLSLLIIGLSAGLFKMGFTNGLITPTHVKDYEADLISQEDYPKFNSAFYSLETFLPLVKLQLADYWLPNANCGTPLVALKFGRYDFGVLTSGGLLRFWYWFHIIAGWVLTSLWVGRLTGLIKT